MARLPEVRLPDPPLHVLPRGTATVTDYAALMDPRASVNRKVGWAWDASLGPEFADRDGTTKRHGGRRKLVDAVVTIAGDDPYRDEYVKALRAGDLWAADPETARAAGVAFEPHFLGEHPETSRLHGVDPMDNADVRALVKARAEQSEAERLQGLPWDARFAPKNVPGQEKVASAADKLATPAVAVPAVPAKAK